MGLNATAPSCSVPGDRTLIRKEFVELLDALFVLFGVLFVVGGKVAALREDIVDDLLQPAAVAAVDVGIRQNTVFKHDIDHLDRFFIVGISALQRILIVVRVNRAVPA